MIFVPFQKTEVYVEGAVERPGRFEFVPGDDLGTLIEIAGGMTRDARTDTLELQRFVDDLLTERIVVAADSAGFALPLQDGDQVLVRHRAEYRPVRTVTVRGEVRFPGPYGIVEGVDRVQDVIRAAGGITTGGSLPQARLIRTEGAEEIDLEYERLKSIPVQDMSETEYAYFKSRSRETKGTVVVDFERLVAGDDAQNVLLRPGDVIDVPQRRETVTVSGRVTYPGMITYAAGQRAAYYIAQAGGFSSQADRGETKVIQARTGEWASVNEAGVIVPGDEIWVPERPERNWWALTKDLVGFTASVAAIYLVIDQASR